MTLPDLPGNLHRPWDCWRGVWNVFLGCFHGVCCGCHFLLVCVSLSLEWFLKKMRLAYGGFLGVCAGCAPGLAQMAICTSACVLKLVCEGRAKSLILFCNILAMKSARWTPHSLETADISAPPRTLATCGPSNSPLHLRGSCDNDGRQRRIIQRRRHWPMSTAYGGSGRHRRQQW
jgi:hypothetical protein